MKPGFHQGLQIPLQHHLRDTIPNRGDTKRPLPPVRLRYLNRAERDHPKNNRAEVSHQPTNVVLADLGAGLRLISAIRLARTVFGFLL